MTIPLDGTGCPDLQVLVERAGRRHAASIGEKYVEDPSKQPPHQGGYQHITPEEWAEYDRAMAAWQRRRREGLMAATTKISWADGTVNFWIGCTKVSDACEDCYAVPIAASMGIGWGDDAPRHRTSEQTWNAPLRWNACTTAGRPK